MVDNILHEERVCIHYSLFERIAHYILSGKKLLPVGTTSCRVLESLPYVWKSISDIKFSDECRCFWDDLSKDIDSSRYIADVMIGDD